MIYLNASIRYIVFRKATYSLLIFLLHAIAVIYLNGFLANVFLNMSEFIDIFFPMNLLLILFYCFYYFNEYISAYCAKASGLHIWISAHWASKQLELS